MDDYLKAAFNLMINLKASVSPFHTVKYAKEWLSEAGFEELAVQELWKLERGGRYYADIYGTTLFAFCVGEDFTPQEGLKIATAHTDWPCLRIKPAAEVVKDNYKALNVEVYGGPILNTWLDRPLSIAGRVAVRNAENETRNVFVDFKRSILTIPNLAIHMNRDVNKGVELNKQTHMLPVMGMSCEGENEKNYFMDMLAKEINADRDDILYYDLYVYNNDAAQLLGADSDFISSPRIDNVTGVNACINAIIAAANSKNISMAVLYDNEEIGSETKQGAGSAITEIIIEKIMCALGISREEYLAMIFKSMILSIDVAHGAHPHYPEKNDITSKTSLNKGVVIKTNANQSYATDADAIGKIKLICEQNDIPYQIFANRSDIRGGSTLGSIVSAFTAMSTVDIGVPILAMHSARELMGVKDMAALNELTVQFFNS